MKIYFEDGSLYCVPQEVSFREHIIINASKGVTDCIRQLDWCKDKAPNIKVYTNSILAFNNEYAWNEEFEVPEVYIVRNGEWVRIDKLTNRELKQGHNLAKLYLNGEFNSAPKPTIDKSKEHTCILCGTHIEEEHLKVCDKCASEYQF